MAELSVYEKLIDEFVLHLKGTVEKPAFSLMGVEVKKQEQYQGDYEILPAGAKPRISIGLVQTRYGTDENDTSMFVGNETMDRIMYFQCSLACKKLWGDKGIVKMTELTEQMLLGYKSVTIGGEAYAFAAQLQGFSSDVWYYRVIVRWKHNPLKAISTFRILGDEPLGGDLVEATFTPEHITP